MSDPVTAALLKEAGALAPPKAAASARPAGFPFESPAENRSRMQDRLTVLKAEVGNPDHGGDQPATAAAIGREIAETERKLGGPVAAPQQEAANDPVTAALLSEAKAIDAKWVPDQAERAAPTEMAGSGRFRPLDSAVGAHEVAASAVTGTVGKLVGNVAGIAKGLFGGKYGTPEGAREAAAYADEVAKALTYEPRTEMGKSFAKDFGEFATQTEFKRLAGIGPAEGMMIAGATAGGTPAAASALRRPPASEGAAASAGGRMGSVGAQGASLASQAEATAAKAGPALQAEVAKIKDWTPQKVKTLERYVDADTLPVPIKIMTGQATDNPTLTSQQFNRKGMSEKTANLLKEQNEKLIENSGAIKERAAPDIFVSSKPELGELAVEGARGKLRALTSETTKAYKALEDANGGAFPMEAKSFAETAYKNLHAKLKAEFLPAGLEKQLEGFLAGKPMNFEQFEAMRTNLANIARSQADGNVKQAAAIVRNALEEMPMPKGAEHLKPLADAARKAAREMHAAIEVDPALKAVYRGKASADNFIDNVILKADRKTLETINANLAHDPVAQQAIKAAAIQRLREAARIVDDKGVFNQAAYNKTLEAMLPKLRVILGAEDVADLEKLGRVARYVKGQDAGTFFNNSNSWVAALGDFAKSGAEVSANVAAKGFPVGTIARKMGGSFIAKREFDKSMQTGAGLQLKDVAK